MACGAQVRQGHFDLVFGFGAIVLNRRSGDSHWWRLKCRVARLTAADWREVELGDGGQRIWKMQMG
jgi:hypothetical protein